MCQEKILFLQRVPPAIVGRQKVGGQIPLAVTLAKRAVYGPVKIAVGSHLLTGPDPHGTTSAST